MSSILPNEVTARPGAANSEYIIVEAVRHKEIRKTRKLLVQKRSWGV